LNIKKCNVISLSYSNIVIKHKYKYSAAVDNAVIDLERCNKVRDLGVIVDSKLSCFYHITEKVNMAYSIFGIIKQNFQQVDKDVFVLLRSPYVIGQAIIFLPCGFYLSSFFFSLA